MPDAAGGNLGLSISPLTPAVDRPLPGRLGEIGARARARHGLDPSWPKQAGAFCRVGGRRGARDEEWVAMQGTPALEMGTRSLACSPPIGCQSLSALCSRHLVDLAWESEGDALLSRGWFAQPLLGWFQGWYSGGTFDSLVLDLDPFSTRTVPSAELGFFSSPGLDP